MNIAIVGAGPSGLTAAYTLLKNGDTKPLLIEKQNRTGGLAKSFVYEGKYVFDIGPKRFHTEDQEVLDFIDEIAKEVQLETIGRSSRVMFLERYFDWPLKTKDLLQLPPMLCIRTFLDLLRKKHVAEERTFMQYIIGRYGKTLFEIFFKPYTEKFLQRPIEDIHRDWGITGVNRSIINKEHKGNSLLELIQGIFLPKNVNANFLYPSQGGFGAFWETCADLVQKAGVPRKLETTVTSIAKTDTGLHLELSDGTSYDCEHLLWSGRLPDLLSCIGLEAIKQPDLPYLDTIFLDIVVREEDVIEKKAVCQWLYVSSGKRQISRISFPKELVRQNVPANTEGLCVEVTQKEGGREPDKERLLADILAELKSMGILRAETEVQHAAVHLERSTYPIYHLEYRQAVEEAFAKVREFSDRIIPMGRCGAFWYNNSDHSIKQALQVSRGLLAGNGGQFDHYGYFGG